MLRQQIKAVSSLLTTMALIGLCVGMTSTLLSIRGSLEGFSTLAIGIIMSAYYLGYLFGSTRAAKDIRRVGYIRAFGSLGALATISILIQALWIEPWVWFSMRFITGFALSAMYVIAESWLNTMADNKSRGALLSVYMVLLYSGLILGQFVLVFADPSSFVPFILIALLLNLSLIPILASVTVEPTLSEVNKVSIRFLLKQAPLGIAATFINQACAAMFYGVGPVYAHYLGFSVPQITLFMAVFIAGGMVAQPPLGLLSDKYDRRLILAACAGSAALIALILSQLSGQYPWLIYIFMTFLGASILPIYSLAMAHTNDFLNKDQMLGATGTIIKTAGIGSIIGAPTVAAMMQFGAIHYFFLLFSALTILIALYALYRIHIRKAPAEQPATPFAHIAPVQATDHVVQSLIEESLSEDDKETGKSLVAGPPLQED